MPVRHIGSWAIAAILAISVATLSLVLVNKITDQAINERLRIIDERVQTNYLLLQVDSLKAVIDTVHDVARKADSLAVMAKRTAVTLRQRVNQNSTAIKAHARKIQDVEQRHP